MRPLFTCTVLAGLDLHAAMIVHRYSDHLLGSGSLVFFCCGKEVILLHFANTL